ncbi:glyceraldehyde-3-phosphate dehydrogenase B [Striga asiatica]|uniref:Glyceraldehyde-3-phosphate dehydrogenase B n=1 Tax=Striga asiatica TaxID=4170 RepID=A0A5A7RBZ4_STRAF|nr:glyceraldehyde-3-phosphate dehydrogenase B [Striga asiatica]
MHKRRERSGWSASCVGRVRLDQLAAELVPTENRIKKEAIEAGGHCHREVTVAGMVAGHWPGQALTRRWRPKKHDGQDVVLGKKSCIAIRPESGEVRDSNQSSSKMPIEVGLFPSRKAVGASFKNRKKIDSSIFKKRSHLRRWIAIRLFWTLKVVSNGGHQQDKQLRGDLLRISRRKPQDFHRSKRSDNSVVSLRKNKAATRQARGKREGRITPTVPMVVTIRGLVEHQQRKSDRSRPHKCLGEKMVNS